MSNLSMIKELRELTQAGMKDCKDALETSNFDLQKAVDLIKTRGKLVVSKNKIAAEGLVSIVSNNNLTCMIEINCVTDFVARSTEFKKFCKYSSEVLLSHFESNGEFQSSSLEDERKNLSFLTKENIVIRRWWVEQSIDDNVKVFSYLHPNVDNAKIGVILTISSLLKNEELCELCGNIAMQIAAMNPLALSVEKLNPSVLDRQKSIFQAQINELNKPAQAHQKIMEGKLNKWYSEVCLLNQEAVFTSKVTINQLIDSFNSRFNANLNLINFIRCEVGENIEKQADNFVDDVVRMVGE